MSNQNQVTMGVSRVDETETLKQLEKKIGCTFYRMDFEELERYVGGNYFSMDETGAVTGLNFSIDVLEFFPEEILKLKHIRILKFWGNKLSTLPEEIGQLEHLQELELGRNQFEVFPKGITDLKKLRKLNFYKSRLSTLPPEIGKLAALERLHVDSNQVIELPLEIRKLKNLKYLFLGYNKIRRLPPGLEALSNLVILHLAKNEITEFPLEMAKIKSLERLDLGGNRITDLPRDILQLEKRIIRYIYGHERGINLYENPITLPYSVFYDDYDNHDVRYDVMDKKKVKEYFDVQDNKARQLRILHELEEEVKKIIKKKFKEVSPNKVLETKQSYAFDENGDITHLNLDGLKMTELPASLFKFKNLTKLILSNNRLDGLPDKLAILEKLTVLVLDSNKLSHFPDVVCRLKNLWNLWLDDNSLSLLPGSLGSLSDLLTLHLGANNFSQFPMIITELTELKTLYLNDNHIAQIPTEIKQLTKLENLDISKNRLKRIPSSVLKLTQLRDLRITDNQLTHLPYGIGSLNRLENLRLQNNQITELPDQITQLPIRISYKWDYPWKGVYLDKNPLKNPPIEIVQKGKDAIINYFKSIDNTETTDLYEAKLLIVGNGGVGKTCLMKKLVTPTIDIDEEEATTEGIFINKWMVNTETITDFRINIWDFGGQAIYHATHQFFLTKRSLYLFVWEARKEDRLIDFDYWLNIIELLSDRSPVIIVLNKIDERRKLIDEAYIKDKFQNIVSFCSVSAATGEGIPELTETIKKEMEKLEHIGTTLPDVWLRIRRELEAMDKNYIDYSQYIDICNYHGLDKKEADNLSQYFHDLGVFIHFQENRILKDIVFLKTEWATNAVYKIVDTKKVITNYGKFQYSDLKDIWADYPETRYNHLLELMEKFELCFPLPNNAGYIFPELLRTGRPDYTWDSNDNLRFEYRYSFMPGGILTRFIVNVHTLINGSIYWKNGVIIKFEESEALIVSEELDRKIKIAIKGNKKKELLGIIRWEIGNIHKTLNNPSVKEMVPCICNQCLESEESHFYEYSELNRYKSKGKSDITCPVTIDAVSVDSILDGMTTTFQGTRNMRVNYKLLQEARADFQHLLDLEPHDRGFEFERFLNKLFEAYNLSPRKPYKKDGEQIDGSFQLNNNTYLVEAKWKKKPIGQADLLVFHGKVKGKPPWVRGLFVSFSGFAKQGIKAYAKGKQSCIIGVCGKDLASVIEGRISLPELIELKARRAAETNEFYTPVARLQNFYDPSGMAARD